MMFIGLNVSLSNLNHNYYAIPNPITQQVLPVVASMVDGLIFLLLASAGFHFQERLSAVSSNPTRVCVCINEAPNCNVTLYNVTDIPNTCSCSRTEGWNSAIYSTLKVYFSHFKQPTTNETIAENTTC